MRIPLHRASVAGLSAILLWIAGLAVWATNVPPQSTDREVVDAYTDHLPQALARGFLVHAAAGVALLIVVRVLASRPGASPWLLRLGVVAAVLPVVQFAIEIVLVAAVHGDDVGLAGTTFDAVHRLDGVKMLAQAGFVVADAAAWSLAARSPRTVRGWGGAAAVLLVVSGVGFLVSSGPLSDVAALSLPGLLVWVALRGVLVARSVGTDATGSAADPAAASSTEVVASPAAASPAEVVAPAAGSTA
jgi:hypothetical protein